MLPGTVAAKFLASAVARRGVITTIKKHQRRAELLMPTHSLTNLEIKYILQTNLNLMVFIQGIIYLKQRMGYIK